MNQEPNIPLELTVTEVNLTLSALGKLPFEQVFQLIAKIKDQGDAALAKQSEREDTMVLEE